MVIQFKAATPEKQGARYFLECTSIEIYRSGWAEPTAYVSSEVARLAADPLSELIFLSHEIGHHLAVQNSLGTGTFAQEMPLETYEEETVAWVLGRQVLEDRGFSDWDRFASLESNSLLGYRCGLGLTTECANAIEAGVRLKLAGAPDNPPLRQLSVKLAPCGRSLVRS